MGMYREFALRAMSMGRRRGRPPVFSAQAFWPYAAERTLAQAVREALLESWRRELAGAVEDSDEGDGGFESSVREAAERAAEAISANAGESLAKFSEMTIGIPYLPAGTERAVLGEWTETFVKLCRSADAQGKADIARAVSGGKMRGENMRQVESAVEASLKGKAKSKAELIARTETGKLNNACTMAGYREAGITRYRWLATPDERTRPSHAAMNGRICAVGEPDTWYEDTERGLERRARTQDMYHGDPGTDFQCRCTCVPWDAAVDSKYGVREVPEPEPREPSPLEREREENERLRGLIERERRERAERERELENARKLAERESKVGMLRGNPEFEEQFRPNHYKELVLTKNAPKDASLKMEFPIQRNSESIAESSARTNPNFYMGTQSFTMNCCNCVHAYEGRRRGYEVTAKSFKKDRDYLRAFPSGKSLGFLSAYKNVKYTSAENMSPSEYKDAIIKQAKTAGNGARFVLTVSFKTFGHVLVAENVGGRIFFIDPQSNEIFQNWDKLRPNPFDCFARIDNLEISENFKKYVRITDEGQ